MRAIPRCTQQSRIINDCRGMSSTRIPARFVPFRLVGLQFGCNSVARSRWYVQPAMPMAPVSPVERSKTKVEILEQAVAPRPSSSPRFVAASTSWNDAAPDPISASTWPASSPPAT